MEAVSRAEAAVVVAPVVSLFALSADTVVVAIRISAAIDVAVGDMTGAAVEASASQTIVEVVALSDAAGNDSAASVVLGVSVWFLIANSVVVVIDNAVVDARATSAAMASVAGVVRKVSGADVELSPSPCVVAALVSAERESLVSALSAWVSLEDTSTVVDTGWFSTALVVEVSSVLGAIPKCSESPSTVVVTL